MSFTKKPFRGGHQGDPSSGQTNRTMSKASRKTSVFAGKHIKLNYNQCKSWSVNCSYSWLILWKTTGHFLQCYLIINLNMCRNSMQRCCLSCIYKRLLTFPVCLEVKIYPKLKFTPGKSKCNIVCVHQRWQTMRVTVAPQKASCNFDV